MSVNANGLRNNLTRKIIFNEIAKLDIDICLIQESFITDQSLNNFQKDWNGELIYSPGTEHSLGNIILLSKNFVYMNLKIEKLTNRIICISFEMDAEKYMILNVYYPCDEQGKCNLHNELT